MSNNINDASMSSRDTPQSEPDTADVYVDIALTRKGQELKAKINLGKGKTSLKITKIVTASGFSETPLELTSVVNQQQEFSIISRERFGRNAQIKAHVNNFGNPRENIPPLEQGYSLSQIGFYANDPDEGEILYYISQFENPNFVPPFRQRPWKYEPTFDIIVGNAKVVHLPPSSTHFATLEMIEERVKNHNRDPLAHEGLLGIRQVGLSTRNTPARGIALHKQIIRPFVGYLPNGVWIGQPQETTPPINPNAPKWDGTYKWDGTLNWNGEKQPKGEQKCDQTTN